MKKVLNYLIAAVVMFTLLLTTVNAANDKKEVASESSDKVTLYLFRQTGCPHCADEMIYLNDHLDELSEKIDIVVYDIYEGNNRELIVGLLDELGIEYEGAPFNVIGKKTFVGFADSIAASFEDFVDTAYKAKEQDVVAKVLSKNNYEGLVRETLHEAMDKEDIPYNNSNSLKSEEKESSDTIVIVGIIAGVAILTGVLIYFSKRK